MGLNDCGKNTMCILEIVSNSLSCNNTEVRCSTLDRLIYASSSSRALDCYTHMPDQRSGCPWYKKLGIEAAVLGAYAGCVVADIPDGETLLVPCILAATEVLGATADCVCDIIPDKFKSVACDMPDRRGADDDADADGGSWCAQTTQRDNILDVYDACIGSNTNPRVSCTNTATAGFTGSDIDWLCENCDSDPSTFTTIFCN